MIKSEAGVQVDLDPVQHGAGAVGHAFDPTTRSRAGDVDDAFTPRELDSLGVLEEVDPQRLREWVSEPVVNAFQKRAHPRRT